MRGRFVLWGPGSSQHKPITSASISVLLIQGRSLQSCRCKAERITEQPNVSREGKKDLTSSHSVSSPKEGVFALPCYSCFKILTRFLHFTWIARMIVFLLFKQTSSPQDACLPHFSVGLHGIFAISNLSPALPSVKIGKEMFLSNHFFHWISWKLRVYTIFWFASFLYFLDLYSLDLS